MKVVILAVLCIVFVCGCTGEPERKTGVAVTADDAATNMTFNTDAILNLRKEKDDGFGTSQYSPLPDSLKDGFKGLLYYPPAEKYAVPARFTKFPDSDTVQVQATKSNDVRMMLKYGEFAFSLDGRTQRLIAYKYTGNTGAQHPYLLFVPFKDATNGRDTYEAGRYMDIREHRDSSADYLLDFNAAYNPYCAYNDAYSCPLVPEQNQLTVKIQAGEKAKLH